MRVRSTELWVAATAALCLGLSALALSACGGGDVANGGGGADVAAGDDVALPGDGAAGEDGVEPGADAKPVGTDAAPDESTPPGGVTVDTAVAPGVVAAGEEAEITCSAVDDEGGAVTAEFAIDVTPAGFALDGTTFSAEVAGTYQIACRALPDGPADATPFALIVQPGPAAGVVATVDPDTIEAGAHTTVACRLEDAFGNEVAATGWTVAAPDEVTVSGLDVTATVAGDYDLTCVPAGEDGDTLDNEPAVLTVVAGPAVGIALTATPARAWYAVNTLVTIGYEVRDAHGNPVDEDRGPLTVTVEPATGLEAEAGAEGQLRFTALGVYTVSGSVPGPPAGEAELTLTCDPDPPVIELTQPERGLTQSTPSLVTVAGRAHDATAGVASLRINDTAVALAPDGAFSLPLALRQGLNLIVVVAEDGVGHTAEVMRSVYYSPVWYALDEAVPGAGLVNDALLAFVGRLFFYAQDDPGMVTVSSLVGDIVRNVDLGSLLPVDEPLTTVEIPLGCTASDIYLSDVHYSLPAQITIGGRTVSNPVLNPIDGGLRVFVMIENLNAALELDSATPGGSGILCLNDEGRVLADAVILSAEVYISLDANGAPVLDIQGVGVTIEGVRTQDLGLAGGLVNMFADFLTGFLTGMIEDAVVDQLDGLLGGLTEVLVLDFDFDLDPFIGEGEPVTLRIETDFSRFEFTGADPGAGLHLGAGVRIVTTPRIDRQVLGSIGRGSCLGAPESFALAETGKVELGLAFDALNEALFALWQGGLLHLDITAADLGDTDLSQFGITDLAVQTDPLLPPIATSCTDDGQLVAQVGDFWVHATFGLFGTPTDVTAYLHTEVALDPVVVDGETGPEPGVEISEIRFLEAEIVALNAEQEPKRQMLLGLLEEALPTVLLNEVAAEPITFALPTLDLGSLDDSGILPQGVVLQILIESLGHRMGYVTGEGNVDRAPAPAP